MWEMISKPFTGRTIALYGAAFGGWTYGWLATADWLISSGLLAHAAGVDTAFPKTSLLGWAFSRFTSAIPTSFFVSGPLGVGAAAIIGALAGWVCWRVGRRLNIDPQAHAFESVCWAARAFFSARFGLLMLTYISMIACVVLLKELTGWPYWKFILGAAAIIVIGMPLQLCQPLVVGGNGLGAWWQWTKLSRGSAVLVALILGASATLARLITDDTLPAAVTWWIISTIIQSALATLLVRRAAPFDVSWRLLKNILAWRRISAWLLRDAMNVCLLGGIFAPFAASIYLNTFAMPAILHSLQLHGLEPPQWLSFYLSLSHTVSDYWYVASVVLAFGPVYAWLSLCAGRLAYLQSNCSNTDSNSMAAAAR